jgi:Cu+-exporting ATPase
VGQPALHCCAGCSAVRAAGRQQPSGYYRLTPKGQKVKPVELAARLRLPDLESVQSQRYGVPVAHAGLAHAQHPADALRPASGCWRTHLLNAGIRKSRVNFLRSHGEFSRKRPRWKDVVTLLAAINYEPQITLAELARSSLSGQPHCITNWAWRLVSAT